MSVPLPVAQDLTKALLKWYDSCGRDLPWRLKSSPSQDLPDPYRVWLSEIMLQQTTVATVKQYFERFIKRWPTVEALAQAPLEDVLHAWQGLGYYARARNLHRCARMVVSDQGGRFPDTLDSLRTLPGIGVYTAAAIAAIAYNLPETVVDGNVMRVIARLFGIMDPFPAALKIVTPLAAALTLPERPGDYAQALMDLGATICTPRSPSCDQCPWQSACIAFARHMQHQIPVSRPKPLKPHRFGTAWCIFDSQGAIALVTRPSTGLLGGMMGVPTSDWTLQENIEYGFPFEAEWHPCGQVGHTFTHFHLHLDIQGAFLQDRESLPGVAWSLPEQLQDHALPTLMKKVIAQAYKHLRPASPK